MYTARIPEDSNLATLSASVLYNLAYHNNSQDVLTQEQRQGILGACSMLQEEGYGHDNLVNVCTNLYNIVKI